MKTPIPKSVPLEDYFYPKQQRMQSGKKNMITFVKNKDENMNKTFNIYCDESCHIENDHKKYMFLGSISSAYPQVKRQG